MQQTGERADTDAGDGGITADEAAVIAHDLRNPLNAAMCSLQTARRTGEAEHFDRAERTLHRMDEIIEQLLALGHGGAADLDREQVSLATIAEQAWDTTPTAAASLVISDDVTLEADRSALGQLLSNLFDNAVTHGGDDVTVRVGSLADGDGFFVADDGTGVPAEDGDDVFEFGYTTDPGGNGYGLAIVERIASAHGWDASLAESDDGARFDFA